MDIKDFSNLGRGDIVRHKRNRSTSYVVDVNHGGSITAMATVLFQIMQTMSLHSLQCRIDAY